jgi:hypothetical protein
MRPTARVYSELHYLCIHTTGTPMPFRPRVQLAAGVGRDFERLALPYFQFVFPGIVRPTPLAIWDRRGVDLMTTPERSPVEVCVQCKSTSNERFEKEDIEDFKHDIEKFIASGIQCDRYIIALNRNDYDGLIQTTLENYVKNRPSKLNLEIWKLARIVDEAQDAVRNLILVRIKVQRGMATTTCWTFCSVWSLGQARPCSHLSDDDRLEYGT